MQRHSGIDYAPSKRFIWIVFDVGSNTAVHIVHATSKSALVWVRGRCVLWSARVAVAKDGDSCGCVGLFRPVWGGGGKW